MPLQGPWVYKVWEGEEQESMFRRVEIVTCGGTHAWEKNPAGIVGPDLRVEQGGDNPELYEWEENGKGFTELTHYFYDG